MEKATKETRGRKPEPDKKQAVTIYVRKSKIKQFGGDRSLKKKLLDFIGQPTFINN